MTIEIWMEFSSTMQLCKPLGRRIAKATIHLRCIYWSGFAYYVHNAADAMSMNTETASTCFLISLHKKMKQWLSAMHAISSTLMNEWLLLLGFMQSGAFGEASRRAFRAQHSVNMHYHEVTKWVSLLRKSGNWLLIATFVSLACQRAMLRSKRKL